MNDREAFETFITAPPFKRRSLGRFDALGAWPGNYINNEINFAWKVWQAATEAERERCAKVCGAIAHDWRGANSQSVQCADAIRKGE